MRSLLLIAGAVLVIVMGAALLFPRLGIPSGQVFDEVIYPGSAVHLLHGENVEPSHPPLGKLIIGQSIRIFGDNPIGWRAASAVAGVLILLLIYVWAFQLTQDVVSALVAAGLTAANGVWFVLSRCGTLDAITTMFLFAGIVAVTAVLQVQISPTAGGAIAGMQFGMCMACKWMALFPIAAVCVLFWIYSKRAIVPMLGCFALIYTLWYSVLAEILNLRFTLGWFISQQTEIFRDHAGHYGPISTISHWYEWPFKVKPQVAFFDERAHVLLLGNPVILWWGFALAWFLLGYWWISRDKIVGGILLTFAVLYGQYAVMPLKTEFYHYYLAGALVLSVIAVRALLRRAQIALLSLSAWAFLWAYPAYAAIPSGHWTRFL